MNTVTQAKQTLDQRRAKHAWHAVQAAKKQEGCHKMQDPKKFGGQARKLPIRTIASGLGQALAFLKAKNYAPGLLVEIGDWVLDKRVNPESEEPKPRDDALLNHIIMGTSDFLRRATDEVLVYLQWLNRFAEAENLTEGEE